MKIKVVKKKLNKGMRKIKVTKKKLNISSLGQMALESTSCGIVHHARRTRAHCPTMVSSFKLSSGTVCLLKFSCRAGHIRKGKYKICGSYQVCDLWFLPMLSASGHTACVMHNATAGTL